MGSPILSGWLIDDGISYFIGVADRRWDVLYYRGGC